MNSIKAFAATLCIAASAQFAQAQEAGPARSRDEILTAARQIIDKARFCTLITIGTDGAPQARTIDQFPPEPDMTVWIGTNPKTRKVAEITREPRVALHCFDNVGIGYVTLIGRAEVVRDSAVKAAHWKPDWARFYKNEYRGDDYVLIRVQPSRLEVVSYAHKLLNDPDTWRPVTVEFTSPPPKH